MQEFIADGLYVFGPDEIYRGHELGEKPVPNDMAGVRGVFVGGCVAGELPRMKEDAHAHTDGTDYHGWVCFLTPANLEDPEVRAHELAHILTGQGHTIRWRNMMAQLGYPEARVRSPAYQRTAR
ncbi:MAG TPA: hypothetical protein VLA88_02760 [Candidatus Saccharimonadales bacterium]|nr:hypothetical protein [Candidatus Saccharimonadales bacterium]